MFKADNLKALFVYGNVTFIIVAGFYVLYQLTTRTDLSPEQVASLGTASIFAGFVGMAIQFLTGQEIATRTNRAAASNFETGLAAPTPPVTTVTTSEGPPATSTTVTTGPNTLSGVGVPNVLSEDPPGEG